ncbi:MAG: hypothetical protein WCQ99_13455 [Pseudomonadota bacterium]
MEKCPGILLLLFGAFIVLLSASRLEAQDTLSIRYEKGLLSVDALNVKAEDLFLELGRQCSIAVIAHGNVFPEQKVSINFTSASIKEGIKKLAKACNLKNYMMDFKKEASGETRLVKLDLFMGGAGERVLTKAGPETPGQTAEKPQAAKNPPAPASMSMQVKSSFSKDSKFQWDGSAPIAFPEYTGRIPYEAGKYSWGDDAKVFSKRTMDIIPPAVRDSMSGALVTTCDDIARERNAQTITPEIAAEAAARLARQENMPETVMKNIPKKMGDFEKPKIPIAPEHINEQYR